jgi:hypothetical protein
MIAAVKSCKQCKGWTASAYLLGTFFIVFLALHFNYDYSPHKVLLLSMLCTFMVAMALWTVKTLYHMLCWWRDLQQNISDISNLLAETKQEINNIKSIKHELSSR